MGIKTLAAKTMQHGSILIKGVLASFEYATNSAGLKFLSIAAAFRPLLERKLAAVSPEMPAPMINALNLSDKI